MGENNHMKNEGLNEFVRGLKVLMDRDGWKMKPLSLAAGMGDTGVRDMFRYNSAPKVTTAHALAQAMGTTIDEIIRAGGGAEQQASQATAAYVENGLPAPPGLKLVSVYDVTASAGDGLIVDFERIVYSLAFPPNYLKRITTSDPRNLTIISVKGDSMEPTLSDDDIVMLDMSKTSLSYEGLFVIRVYDVLHVKRLSHSRPGYVMVISDNSALYPAREYSLEDVKVVGKVLWSGGKV
jgi:phage repressor protein C with HTH and peptisase S24 domain